MKITNCLIIVKSGSGIELTPEDTRDGSFAGNVVWPVEKLQSIPREYLTDLDVGAVATGSPDGDKAAKVGGSADQLDIVRA